MLEYLLRSVACFALFYGGYWMLLQNTSKHQLKRVYLLGSVVLSMLIPLITFTTYLESSNQTVIQLVSADGVLVEEEHAFNWLALLWGIYITGAAVLLVRFIRNLVQMYRKVYKNERNPWPNHWKVLLGAPTEPHTFLRYIFLNRKAYNNQEIPEAVLLHEQAHATQWHTLDLILLELLQVVFWFNPFIPLFRRAIKLNHEFLADQAVIDHGIPRITYQHTLLAFSSNAAVPTLAHGINYSSFKKRLTVMRTQTSNKQMRWRLLLLVPVLALALYSFSNKEVAYLETEDLLELQEGATKAQIKEYNKLAKKYNKMDPENLFIKKDDVVRMEYLYHLMTPAQRKGAEPFPVLPPPPPPPPPTKVKAETVDGAPAPPPPPSPKLKDGSKIVVREVATPGAVSDSPEYEVIEIMEVPPPPPNPLEHMKKLAKEDADFYYEGRKITAKQAIHIVKKNDLLNIQVKDCDGKRTEVRITKNPIKLP